MLRRSQSPFVSASLITGVAALGLSLLSGCGVGTPATGTTDISGNSSGSMGGILHGGPNPIIGAVMTLYTTTSAGYGATATKVATTTTLGDGSFAFVLPTNAIACPTGEYAYVGAYSGSTGATGNNASSLLMVPIGLCDTNYSSVTTDGGITFTNTYLGTNIWIDELTTTVSSYTLGNFMKVTNAGDINIGAPANNHGTASSTTPSAAGLAHAFANALGMMNIHTGQPFAWTHGGTSNSTGGIIPDDEIFLLGNILQACVNSTGVSGTNNATANDGTACGKLFSFTTPPQAGAAVPTNTLQAMVDLAKYPNPSVNTWNAGCTAAGTGSNTATSCLFNLAPPTGAYTNALLAAPADWALAVVYASGYGANTTATGCTVAGTCPGVLYPYYLALDASDNVYIVNWDGSAGTTPNHATTSTNILGIGFDGTPLFASPKDTTNLAIEQIATDTASHVFGAVNLATGGSVKVYSTSSGSLLTTVTTGIGANPEAILADPFNNIYVASSNSGTNIRKLAYGAGSPPTYVTSTFTGFTPLPVFQMGWDSSLDFYAFGGTASGAAAYYFVNTNGSLTSAPTFATTPSSTASNTGSTSNSSGFGVTSTGNAYAMDSLGLIPISKSGSTITTGSTLSYPQVVSGTYYNRYLSIDGNNWVVSVDGANGGATSGITVYDTTDNIALGTYKGCFVISKVCGTTSAGQVPIFSPRDAAIDSAGDVWVVSGASANLTELIGAAAPTWPALSMGKLGLPQ